MKYEIEADPLSWTAFRSSKSTPLTYDECADHFGHIKILFSLKGKTQEYNNGFVNIPLFLGELSDFLKRINDEKYHIWYLGFAPFAYGQIQANSMVISSKPGKEFTKNAYDIMADREVTTLKHNLARDISKFGEVYIDTSKAGRLVKRF